MTSRPVEALRVAVVGAGTAGAAAALLLARAGHRVTVRYDQLASRWLTPFFQGDSAALGAHRDALFPIADAIGLLRGQMLRSMAVVKRGLFARSLGPGELALDEDDEAAP